jgi:hypothetical protein
MFRRDDNVIYTRQREPDEPAWPLYVRVLAVSYVLSYLVQPVAFFGLAGAAVVLYCLGHPLDGLVVGLGVGGVLAFLLCEAFRRWFVRWGKRRYPNGKPE